MTSLGRRLRLSFTCLAIASNALCAGGIFTFPIISSSLAAHLKLMQPQLTTIVLAGMIGQYPFAALVGKMVDLYGPWACSLASSFLFSTGFGLFALEISKTPDDIEAPSSSSFLRLTLFFFLAGLGTVTSYFSSVFAASKNFPEYSGAAAGTSMALFGLSPLVLSLMAGRFTTSQGQFSVLDYMTFLAILTGLVHLLGAFCLDAPTFRNEPEPGSITPGSPRSPDTANLESNEETPLLGSKLTTGAGEIPNSQTVLDLLKDPSFWILAASIAVLLGSSEMVLSNIGSIVLSLPSTPDAVTESATNLGLQVRILSVSNTVSRLLVGPVADIVSPVGSSLPCGTVTYPRKHHVSRVAFISTAATLLTLSFGTMALGIRSENDIWILSLGTGVAYGTIWTVLPGIVSSIWGMRNLGRNFGVISYSPFVGTPLFSYLYAFVSASHARAAGEYHGVCEGAQCWQVTFTIATMCTFLSMVASLVLWKEWRGRV